MVFASPLRQLYHDGTTPAHLSGLTLLDNFIVTRKSCPLTGTLQKRMPTLTQTATPHTTGPLGVIVCLADNDRETEVDAVIKMEVGPPQVLYRRNLQTAPRCFPGDWAVNQYRRFGYSFAKAGRWLRNLAVCYPGLFVHWQYGFQFT